MLPLLVWLHRSVSVLEENKAAFWLAAAELYRAFVCGGDCYGRVVFSAISLDLFVFKASVCFQAKKQMQRSAMSSPALTQALGTHFLSIPEQ